MRILCVGDVCGSRGCSFAARVLPGLRRREKIDFTVINGENSADGNGITPTSAAALFACGADVITGGNHTMRRRELHSALEDNPRLLRPDNISAKYGGGYYLADAGRAQIAVINLAGQIYMKDETENPFHAADSLVERAEGEGADIILLDFHAEATSEKKALGFYLDGRVSAVFGTHTHVQTTDIAVLPGGTGYITDLGMTGPEHSVLGVKKEIIINRLKNGAADKFEQADGKCMLNGCIFEIDNISGKAVSAKTVMISEVQL